jgi:hypothetical protein
MKRLPDYCGCCGRESSNSEIANPWCRDCRDHVLVHGAPWERTYFAQHGADCPFQIESAAVAS